MTSPAKRTWLIERHSASFPVFYLVAENYGGLNWTEDPHKAQRFPAEEWARKLIDRTVLRTFDDLHIAEHMFIAEPSHVEPADLIESQSATIVALKAELATLQTELKDMESFDDRRIATLAAERDAARAEIVRLQKLWSYGPTGLAGGKDG